jgi:hypothetical protein
LFSILPPSISAYKDGEFVFSVQESELISRAVQVCEILKAEFILHPPCVSTVVAVRDGIEKMRDYCLLRFEMVSVRKGIPAGFLCSGMW